MTDEEKLKQCRLDLEIAKSDYKLLEETHKELLADWSKLDLKYLRLKRLAFAMAEFLELGIEDKEK